MKKILLVDDVKLFIAMEKSLLNREGLEIFTANSGPAAIETHKREKVNLILLDLNMPGMNGDEVCRIIRNDNALNHVSIIMVTTSSKKEDIEKCMNAGANDYITKPINATDLLNKVGKYLNIPHRHSLRVLSRVEVKAQTGDRDFFANTVNISTGGVLLESSETIKVGDMLTISLIIPGSFHPIKATGTIVRKIEDSGKTPQYGVRFIVISEKDRGLIDKYIDERKDA